MQEQSLHTLRNPSTMLKYALVLSILISVALSIFSEWHNPSHVLQTDQHCALCLSSDNFDHSIPLVIPHVLVAPSAEFITAISAESFQAHFVRVSGNRDPPLII